MSEAHAFQMRPLLLLAVFSFPHEIRGCVRADQRCGESRVWGLLWLRFFVEWPSAESGSDATVLSRIFPGAVAREEEPSADLVPKGPS